MRKASLMHTSTWLIAGAFVASPFLQLSIAQAATTATNADRTVTASYACNITGATGPQTVAVAVTLNRIPTSVKAGTPVTFEGRLSVTFPDLVATESKLTLASKASIGATEIHLPVMVGGRSNPVVPVLKVDNATSIGRPFTLSTDISLPTINVPEDAAGALDVYLPGDDPEAAAFTSAIVQNSLLQATRDVSCATGKGAKPIRVAHVPIRGASKSTDPTTSPEATSTPMPLPSTDGGLVTGSPLLGSSVRPAPVPELTDATASTPTSVRMQNAAVPPATARSGTFLPAWTLLVMGAALPAAAIALALRQRALLTRARNEFANTPVAGTHV